MTTEGHVRNSLQVLESMRALAEDGEEREAIEYWMEFYSFRLQELQWAKHRAKTHEVATNAKDYGYWREKGAELRREGEGLDKPWHEDENFGDEAAVAR